MKKSKLILELLENIKRKYPKYFTSFKEDLEPLEKALYKWSYYELLGYYQKWKESFYSFEMIIYILTGFEIWKEALNG